MIIYHNINNTFLNNEQIIFISPYNVHEIKILNLK